MLFYLGTDGRASQLGEQKNYFLLGASFALLQSLEWSQSMWVMGIAPWLSLGHQGPALASQDSTSPYLWIKNPLLLREDRLHGVVSAVGY